MRVRAAVDVARQRQLPVLSMLCSEEEHKWRLRPHRIMSHRCGRWTAVTAPTPASTPDVSPRRSDRAGGHPALGPSRAPSASLDRVDTVASGFGGDHYPTDTAGGFCTAVAVVRGLTLLLERWADGPSKTTSPGMHRLPEPQPGAKERGPGPILR